MKKLKLTDDSFLNMNSIITWHLRDDRVTIVTALNVEDNGILITTEHPGPGSCFGQVHKVEIQEIKRIIREITEYMER